MCDLFRAEGKRCIALSLDDFYLTGQEQEQLALSHPHNKLLEFRGNGELVVDPNVANVNGAHCCLSYMVDF